MMKAIKLEKTIEDVMKWGKERGIEDGDKASQVAKLYEEFGELCRAHLKYKGTGLDKWMAEWQDAVGDMIVVMTMVCLQNGLSTYQCLYLANEREAVDGGANNLLRIGVVLGLVAEDIMEPRIDKETMISSLTNLSCELNSYCNAEDLDPVDCYVKAYDVIKNRKGVMKGGSYVKEEDEENGTEGN